MSGEYLDLTLDDPQLVAALTDSLSMLFALAEAQEQYAGFTQTRTFDPFTVQAVAARLSQDEAVAAQRLMALADLYYLYQHEALGVFSVVMKLRQLLRVGTLRLTDGASAFALYQFDHREALRYSRRDRLQTYAHTFGYGRTARSKSPFHALFSHFVQQLTFYEREKRLLHVTNPSASDGRYASIAVVRRAGIDLRAYLLTVSSGHINVLRVEVMQLLDEALRVLGMVEIKRLFGADTAWDVVEVVQARYFDTPLTVAPRLRLASAGRELLRWLAQPHVLQAPRAEFETQLQSIAAPAEDWLTAAQMLSQHRIPKLPE